MSSKKGTPRSGAGRFPPNPTQWQAERNGLAFRARFELEPDEPLKPFARELPNVTLLATRDQLGAIVDDATLDELFGIHRRKWSGVTIPCMGHFIVIMNETHTAARKNATLMEEFFHIILEHKPSRVCECPVTGLMRREFDRPMEREAYSSAAAALIPYSSMKVMVGNGATQNDLAEHFEVSGELASFRLKTCKLYKQARGNE